MMMKMNENFDKKSNMNNSVKVTHSKNNNSMNMDDDATITITTTFATTTTTTTATTNNCKELHIAPMLHYTTREFRKLMRIFSKNIILWTEMIVDETIQHTTNLDEHLYCDDNYTTIENNNTKNNNNTNNNNYTIEQEHDTTNDRLGTTICQIGGNSIKMCTNAVRIAIEQYKYNEINLNIDCPSNRVCNEREFGAVLMKQQHMINNTISLVQAMNNTIQQINDSNNDNKSTTTKKQISIKCRIGVDEYDSLDYMISFVSQLQQYCTIYYLHGRICVLDGINNTTTSTDTSTDSPDKSTVKITMNARQNRSVPPLNYPRIYQLALLFPHCTFYMNGHITSLQQIHKIFYGNGPSTTTLSPSSSSSTSLQQKLTPFNPTREKEKQHQQQSTTDKNDISDNTTSNDTKPVVISNDVIGNTTAVENSATQTQQIPSQHNEEEKEQRQRNQMVQIEKQQQQQQDEKEVLSQLDTMSLKKNSTNTTTNTQNYYYDSCNHNTIPCTICNVQYGSCVVLPTRTPTNIKGCMIGRIVIDNPCILYNVDTYLYSNKNDNTITNNPCTNRQQVFHQYCSYLESIYPRRCCDTDPRITYEFPSPIIPIDPTTYCPICSILYNTNATTTTNTTTTPTNNTVVSTLVDTIKLKIQEKKQQQQKEEKTSNNNNTTTTGTTTTNIKISSRIIGRSVRPIQGMFYNINKYNKVFRRTCDTVGQDIHIRNCGPGFIIRYALLLCIPNTILEKEFS